MTPNQCSNRKFAAGRILLGLVAGLLVVFIQIGCQRARPVVTFAVFGDPAELAAYEALVDAFEVEQPEIELQLQHIPSQSDYRRRLATSFAGGTPPDVMLLNYRRFAPFAADGGLVALQPYFEASEQLLAADFFPIALDSFRWEDELWCIPQNVSSLVVYYNQDLFDAAGLPYPSPDWSRAEFVAAARALTKDIDRDGQIDQYGAGIEPSVFRLAPFLWQAGLELVDDPTAPTRLILDQPEQLAVIRWFVGLQTVEGVVPDANAELAESSENRWLNGTMGMYFNSRRGVPTYRTIDRFEWDVAPLPADDPARWAGILHSDAYCLAAAAENKEAAWAFIEFANSYAGQEIVARSGRTVPSRLDVAASDAFLDGLPPQNASIFIDTVDGLRGVPIIPGWTAVEEITGKEIERAFYGQASVEEAAAAAVEMTQSYFGEP